MKNTTLTAVFPILAAVRPGHIQMYRAQTDGSLARRKSTHTAEGRERRENTVTVQKHQITSEMTDRTQNLITTNSYREGEKLNQSHTTEELGYYDISRCLHHILHCLQ